METTKLEVVTCSFPKCECRGLVDYFYVPSRDEVKKANGGVTVKAADLSRFAVCDRHAAVIRKDGVQCWPLKVARQAVEESEEWIRQQEVRQEQWRRQRQLDAFKPKGIQPNRDKVGNGLGRFKRFTRPSTLLSAGSAIIQ